MVSLATSMLGTTAPCLLVDASPLLDGTATAVPLLEVEWVIGLSYTASLRIQFADLI